MRAPPNENPAPLAEGGNGALKKDRLAGAISFEDSHLFPRYQALPHHADAPCRQLKNLKQLVADCEYFGLADRLEEAAR